MRKSLLVLLTVLMFCAFSAFAQDNATSPSSSSPSAQDSSQTGSSASQGSMSQDSSQSQPGSMSGNAGEQTIEGCIVKQETDYYIQPASGSPTKVSGSDVAAHVGHHVVVHGSQQSASASSSANPTSPGSSSSAASGQPSGSSAGDQTFNVTKVDMIATNCPASMQGSSSSSPDTANPK